jgi:hypothetical protein
MDPTKLLEEEERQWRTNDAYWTPTAKHNAATVANILRWNNFQKNPRAGFRRYIRHIEEKERKDRLRAEIMNHAMENAYNESRLIKRMGPPFYIQGETTRSIISSPLVLAILNTNITTEHDLSEIHKLEEEERKRRMQNPSERQLARELAGAVSGHLNRETELEEKERDRRMTDLGQQKLAQENARHVSLMVRESSFNKVPQILPLSSSISSRAVTNFTQACWHRPNVVQHKPQQHESLRGN